MAERVLSDRKLPFAAPGIARVRRLAPRPTLWQRLRAMGLRGIVYQIAVLAIVFALVLYLFGNMQTTLAARGISTSFGFLGDVAGFSIGETIIPFGSTSTYADAFLVGIVNALRVSLVSIVFATVLGVLLGVARLSSNLLLSRLSGLYIELFRNTPQLVQIAFWYTLITLAPAARSAMEPFKGAFISNRGVYIPWPVDGAAFIPMALFAVGCVGALAFQRWQRRPSLTSRPSRLARWVVFAALIVGLPLLGWFASGASTTVSVPELKGFNFVGGLSLSPEFIALCLGLSLYIAAFLAEIVRAGIQSVSRGQIEAAQSISLSKWTLYTRVILPQALRVMVPPAAAQYVSLIKNSSLGVAIGYPELFSVTNTVTTLTGKAIECTSIMMAAYMIISFSVAILMNLYNRTVQVSGH
ncbi:MULTISPECIES: amino acid ABC transporter permease [unclassified Aurantimonas]|uniref:amino acid ABC transporter permease n=1 Tax=unclassified Aurantimonas TaxID=2638230 RepID=UPI002E16ED8D|nr:MULTISPECIES: ABC transporter permease subunit [unclassified Aurantimonas]MEC5292799.1 ABC transporter permease subunit [Aurantimonas sp. C2-3-R2]MEC5413851.1 ABC transporter permease subunit [Aurantimonas sp. C2-4-R8]